MGRLGRAKHFLIELLFNAERAKENVGTKGRVWVSMEKKIRTKNPGFRPLKINVNKMNSSTASRTPIVQPPIISPKIDGPLTEKDKLAVLAKVKPPFPKLKAFSTAAIVLSYAGYEDEVLSILK